MRARGRRQTIPPWAADHRIKNSTPAVAAAELAVKQDTAASAAAPIYGAPTGTDSRSAVSNAALQ
jgi:hypothetical protein